MDAGEDVFAGKDFSQHLSLYDAMMTAKGKGVTARVLAWPQRDVMAVEIDDQRRQPAAINIDLRMLRYAMQRHTGRDLRTGDEPRRDGADSRAFRDFQAGHS